MLGSLTGLWALICLILILGIFPIFMVLGGPEHSTLADKDLALWARLLVFLPGGLFWVAVLMFSLQKAVYSWNGGHDWEPETYRILWVVFLSLFALMTLWFVL